MRLFHLFLRRAGMQAAQARGSCSTSRLTVVCSREHLPSVRRQIHRNLNSDGIQVTQLSVDYGEPAGTVRASITIECPPGRRAELMSRARQLQGTTGVHEVRWASGRKHALN